VTTTGPEAEVAEITSVTTTTKSTPTATSTKTRDGARCFAFVAARCECDRVGVGCCREVLELVKGSPVLEGLGRALRFGDDEVAAHDGDQVDLYGGSRPVREPNVELANVELGTSA
jgi:hypothetical protein